MYVFACGNDFLVWTKCQSHAMIEKVSKMFYDCK